MGVRALEARDESGLDSKSLSHFKKKNSKGPLACVVAHACNLSTQEAEAGGLRVLGSLDCLPSEFQPRRNKVSIKLSAMERYAM